MKIKNHVTSSGQVVYGFYATRSDMTVWLNVGMVYSPTQRINERVASYIKQSLFSAKPNQETVNAEFPFACVVKAITQLGWTVEAKQLSEN